MRIEREFVQNMFDISGKVAIVTGAAGALGIGNGHVPIMLATVAMGGHLRVGMEDNVYFAARELAESNAQLVTRAADIVRIAGNKVAMPAEARELLGL